MTSENGQGKHSNGEDIVHTDHNIVPAPLNPADPLNNFVHALGGNGKNNFHVYPGIDGIPHRATGVRMHKKNDPESMQPQRGGQIRCVIFNLGDPKHVEAYGEVCSRVYTMSQQGKAEFTHIDRQFVQQTGTWQVMLEWVEYFTYDNVGKQFQTQVESGILRSRG